MRAFERDGRLDPGFSGEDGKCTVNFGGRGFDIAYGLAVRGRSILATGSTVAAPEKSPAVALTRLGWGGGVTRGFGRRRDIPSPGGGIGRAVALQPDGRILVAGRAYSDSSQDTSDSALLRYRRSGQLDPAFGAGGIVITDFGTGEDSARAVVVRDGRILVAGLIYSSQGLARYLPSAAPDEAAIRPATPAPASNMTVTKSKDVVVIGGGQAGLAIGYYLRSQGRDFTILEAADGAGGGVA